MQPLSATQLLDLWEQGRGWPPLQQALLLLGAACPELTRAELAQLPIGQRDDLLFKLRQWTLGPSLACVVNCPACGERLEFALDSKELPLAPGEATTDLSMEMAGYRVTFRLPNSLDVAAVASEHDLARSQQMLLARCLLTVQGSVQAEGAATGIDELPESVIAAILQQMEAADPLADFRIALTCPACAHQWNALFDIVSFFWRELDDWAQRTLREVHLLAAAYGWREAEILALSAWRRRAYLEMVGNE